MSVDNDLDLNTLSWVKAELDDTLGQARSALEVYVEDEADETQLQFVKNYLHQVYGTLQMVELYGAAMAAEEMEHLLDSLIEGEIGNRNDAYEVLMRGILQLPDYLDHLLAGHQDMPMVLLPLLNDMRATRGESLLSDNALFNPDLAVKAPVNETITGENLSELTRKLRHNYHLGLLGWFRDQDSDASLARIAEVINTLRESASEEEMNRLLWVASGLVESLRQGGLDSNVSIKLLLGQLDRQFKKIIDNGVTALSHEPPAELLKNLLYYVASSQSDGELTREIKEAFKLKDILPGAGELERARADLSGPNAQLMKTVSTVLLEDLTRVKDNLDLFVRAEERHSEELRPVCDTLKQMADTLGMLGLGVQRNVINEQIETLEAMVSGEREVDDTTLMDMAGAMLSIENSLGEIATARAANEEYDENTDKAESAERLQGVERQKLLQTVIEQAKVELARIKEVLSDFSREPGNRDILAAVPHSFEQIRGSILILNLDRAADLLDRLTGYIRKLQVDTAAPDEDSLDHLADAISSIEYYLESLAGKWGNPDAILNVAEQSLNHLSQGLSEAEPATPRNPDGGSIDEATPEDWFVSEEDGGELENTVDNSGDSPDKDDEEAVVLGAVDDLSVNLDNLDETGLEGIQSTEEQNVELSFGEENFTESEQDGAQSVERPAAAADLVEEQESPATEQQSEPASGFDEVDDEIIDIFMEEAQEEHANIQRLLPQWLNNPQDNQALHDLRRSFHTLKGSGRLVGASDVGEFAWAFENMLNRVIDKTIEPGPEMFQVLEQAEQALPEIFEQFRQGSRPSQSVLALMEHADALSHGKSVALKESSAAPAPDETAASSSSADATQEAPEQSINIEENETEAAGIDPVLLDIYRKEVDTHLATLQTYISNWYDGVDRSASNDLLRALHTLTGSSRTTGITSVAELCSVFEKYIKELQQYSQPVDQAMVELLEVLHGYVSRAVEIIEQPGAELPDSSGLMASIQSMLDNFEPPESSDLEQQIAQPAEGESPATPAPPRQPEAQPEEEASASAEATQPEEEVSAPAEAIQPEEEASASAEPLSADYDSDLLDIFIEEGEEILEQSDDTLLQWRDEPDNQALIESLQRQLHTLKGGARMAGVSEIGDLGHSLESMLTAVVDGHMAVSPPMFGLVQRAQDRLVGMLEQVKQSLRPQPAEDLVQEVDSLLGRPSLGRQAGGNETAETEAGNAETVDAASGAVVEDDVVNSDAAAPDGELADTAPEAAAETELPSAASTQQPAEDDGDGSRDRRKASRVQYEQVRVRADLLDNLVNFAGEVSIYRSRMEQQTNAFRFNLQELDDTVSRLREQLRQFEIEAETQIQFKKEERLEKGYEDFDPLEFDRFTQMQHLSRGMMESLSDLDSIKGILGNVTRESETLLLQQSRVNTELQEGLMRTRMVPFSGQAPRLRRIVRQTADEMGKQVELHLAGVDAELDRQVLDRVIPPIEHMLRNAVAHGIESPEQRQAAGKPDTGNVNMALTREGSDIVIRIYDDGKGLDLKAIHQKAIERGLLNPGEKVNKDILLNMIMQSGFSTADEVTQIAGRGVGMDVVNSEIKQLGGLLEIDTEEGRGASFTISLPLTLAISRALMVYVGDELYAVPLLNVQGVERISNRELRTLMQSDDPVYTWVNEDYKLLHLGNLLGGTVPAVPDDDERLPLLLVRSGDYRAAIRVEGLTGSREIVVKPVGPQLSTLRGISGATIMGDGSVVLILDLAVLVRLTAVHREEEVIDLTPQEAPKVHTKPVVMIVDDSITVRRVTTRLLERNGFEVVQAKDGVDALSQLQEQVPDIMLLDVEMPRMDGYELAGNMRGSERTQDVPIIMITSRTGEKHRQRAMDVGVNVYMGKPYNDASLLENINSLIGQ
ncbi:Hpt domain-containing protein [Thiohalophilus thiocyanatoxydans]|uniref:Chemotaxis protein CheA n=1 Tax=Thiohalophilus thiocyanatoxydans TaxID=381308 RepID=A0A4V3H4R0_9GAMM|nr:Hpt domain-containing protein [Thiohalophilus thiocyanatoxydans]TDY04175.1 chemosensory pili system protein ChpA (sensor histidine kinase/response regulator) [Thiohalophilus thiocyanatoxydans]